MPTQSESVTSSRRIRIDPWILWAVAVLVMAVVGGGLWVWLGGLQMLWPPGTISLFVLSEGDGELECMLDEDLSPSDMVEGVEATFTAEIRGIRLHNDEMGMQSWHVLIRDPRESDYPSLVDNYDGRLAAAFINERPICHVRLSRKHADRVEFVPINASSEKDYWRIQSEIFDRLFSTDPVVEPENPVK